MNQIVNIKDFSVQLGTFQLNNINLDIDEKEIFAVLGKTGSGKTVLLEAIAGFYKGNTGEVLINGQNVIDLSIEKRNIGFVYQDFGLFPHMTVYNNISYGLKMQKIDSRKRQNTVEKMAEILSIRHILSQYPGTLSGGECQRTALARALVLNPQLLLMDEPFSALDPSTKQEMYQQIEEIHRLFGCTIIFVTHDFHEAQRIAGRIGIMVHGQLKAIRKSEDLFISCGEEEINEFLGIKKKKGAAYERSSFACGRYYV